MRKRSRKEELERLAKAVAEMLLQEADAGDGGSKNPIAVALGRKGGLKGGHARAAKMSADERSASAKHAAMARWAKKEASDQ